MTREKFYSYLKWRNQPTKLEGGTPTSRADKFDLCVLGVLISDLREFYKMPIIIPILTYIVLISWLSYFANHEDKDIQDNIIFNFYDFVISCIVILAFFFSFVYNSPISFISVYVAIFGAKLLIIFYFIRKETE